MAGGLGHRRLNLGFGWPPAIDPALASGYPLLPFPFSFFSFLFLPPIILLPFATISVMVARSTRGGRQATSLRDHLEPPGFHNWCRQGARPGHGRSSRMLPLSSLSFPSFFSLGGSMANFLGRSDPTECRLGADGGHCRWLRLSEPMSMPPGPNQGRSWFSSRFHGVLPSGPLPFPPRPPRVARLLPPSASVRPASLGTRSDQGQGVVEHHPCSLSFSLLTRWRFDLVDGVQRQR